MKATLCFALLLVIGIMDHAVSEGTPMSTKPALNEPARAEPIGARPYEMEGRVENRVPLVDFENLSGWTVESADGASAELSRSREQQMWGQYVGKLTYTGKSEAGTATLRPPKPIPVVGDFDSISMWIWGSTWEWAPEAGTPFLEVSLIFTDASGNEESVYLTRIRWKEWWLAHRKLASTVSGGSFTGIRIKGISNAEARRIYLDSLCLYKEALKPLKFEPRPARNLKLYPGQDQGLNGTGPGRLPFPTREETILPSLKTPVRKWSNAFAETSPQVFEFRYSGGKDSRIRYIYEPKTGSLGEITACLNGKKVSIPMYSGGIEVGDKVLTGKLLNVISGDAEVRAVFEYEDGGSSLQAEYVLRIWQKSLVIDFICRGGKATGVSLGEVHDVDNPRLVLIPFLTFGGSNPKVLCSGSPEKPCFTSVWVDWYRSNGSMLWSQEWAQTDSARINGGVRYTRKTDGRLNDLYERVFLTISPVFEETLPTIANPPTPHGALAGERLWQESWGPENYEKEHSRSKMLRSYGIDKLTQCNHEITWRDGGESFTLRTRSAPGKGGDEALRKYIADQKSLGWFSGLYTNYTDYAPVNEYWDEDHVQLTPDGEWRAAWPRCYALKPSRAVEWDAKLAPVVHEKFGTTAAYTDVQTAVAPWNYCDFDARVPGAGTFAATFYAYGELLLHDQRVYGPVWSEGTFQCLYAGLATGNYGLAYTSTDLSSEPLNVAFDLMKIHTLECDIGMPWTGGFLKSTDWSKPENIDVSIDHFIAATMAYGHIGWLVEEQHGIQRTCRSYYMLQQLQKRYALRAPEQIMYWDGEGHRFDASHAIANEAFRDSRLDVLYDNGLRLLVNGSGADWKVSVNGGDIVLPPWGWYAVHEMSRFREFSALVDGQRMDYVLSPEYEYLDGRGVHVSHGGLSARGSIAVRRGGGSVEIINIFGNDWIGIKSPDKEACVAYDADGRALGPVEVRHAQDDMAWMRASDGARRYVLKSGRQVSGNVRLELSFPEDCVVPGEQLQASFRVTSRTPVNVKRVRFTIGDRTSPTIAEWDARGSRSAVKVSGVQMIAFPDSLKPGEKVWVSCVADIETADGSGTEETWFVLTARPAFEISMADPDGGSFDLNIRSNLHDAPSASVSIGAKNAGSGFEVEPVTSTTKRKHTQSRIPVTIRPPSATGDAADTLVVRVTSGKFSDMREFPVKAFVDYPSTWEVHADTRFRPGAVLRDGRTVPVGAGSGATFHFTSLDCGGVRKPGIFSHPPYNGGVGSAYGITELIVLPDRDCEFRTYIGIKDGGNVSDGVTFSVSAVFSDGSEQTIANEHWAKREWKEIKADLSRLRGQTIQLKLVTDVGPADDPTADWASWGETRIVIREPVMKLKVGQ